MVTILDLLFPKTCVGCGRVGAYLCAKCIPILPLTFPICPLCRKGSVGGVTHERCRRRYGLDGLVSIFSYEAGIKEAVKRLKYRFVRDMGEGFVEVAVRRIDPSVLSFFKQQHFVVCPIPLSRFREQWRGFNQASLLGEILARRMDLQFMPLLCRVKDTEALAELRV